MPVKEYTNRLAKEKSPYLLQHAHNPVNWFPWGDEAFAKAKEEQKPVFLSIGYSTCHWCHVMAHESFEDAQVAAALNRSFVCIKVDREERPDVDAVYMAVCQALTGSGGWPLTILMTPEQKPFWAGTYLPKTAHWGRIGLLELLDAVATQWKTASDELTATGEEIVSLFRQQEQQGDRSIPHAKPDKEMLQDAFQWFQKAYDARWGGFGHAPKFPTPHNLLFLLRYSVMGKKESAQQMAEHTLSQMYRGGIFDHIGGGFSRYSTDEEWLVPHFEKMLYDNALLTITYLEAFRMTNRPLYHHVAERTLRYVLRELTDAQSAFYCGQDADSEGVEGKFYVFTPGEVQKVLGKSDGTALCDWFGITEKGNFEGKSIPNLLDNPRWEENASDMEARCDRLYTYRLARTLLHKDDKVLTSWNALMITALADAGWILRAPSYLQFAMKAQRFLAEHLTNADGRLMVRWRDGEAAHDGQLDDYAFYSFALLKLYQTTYDVCYLQEASRIAEQMLDRFFDFDAGGFFLYAKDGEQLIHRPKETYDGAIPSGNSVAAGVLMRLFRLTGNPKWHAAGEKQLSYMASQVQAYPAGHSAALLAFMEVLYPSRDLICVTAEDSLPLELEDFLHHHAFGLYTLVKNRKNKEALAQTAPFTADYPIPEKGTLYYLCTDNTCSAPMSSLHELQQQLGL